MKWNKTSEVLPELIPVDSDTKVAISKPILCAYWDDECEEWEFEVGEFRRGGRGDDCSLYWSAGFQDDGSPDLWTEFEDPAMPDNRETGEDK